MASSLGTDNYELYRNTVIVNRLTQRQSVNVPWMKSTIRSLLSKAGEAADMKFEDLENNGPPLQSFRERLLGALRYQGTLRAGGVVDPV